MKYIDKQLEVMNPLEVVLNCYDEETGKELVSDFKSMTKEQQLKFLSECDMILYDTMDTLMKFKSEVLYPPIEEIMKDLEK